MWKSTEIRNVEKFRNQKCVKVQKLEMWKITETGNVEKYRNWKCGKIQKLEIWKSIETRNKKNRDQKCGKQISK